MSRVNTSTEADQVLTIPEVADLLKLSRAQVYALTARGDIPSVRIGRSVRVRRDRLEHWLDRQERGGRL